MIHRNGLPSSYDNWRTQGPPEIDHHPLCPLSDDADPICRCRCKDDAHDETGRCRDEKRCLCEGWKVDEDPDCICADLADDDKASAADAREAAREEGWERP